MAIYAGQLRQVVHFSAATMVHYSAALDKIDEDAWATLNSATSRPFPRPESGRIAVKVINHLGDEVMKVFRVG